MDLIEREPFLDVLQTGFEKVYRGEGHCFFITGEAGIGKTSLVKAFLKKIGKNSKQYTGSCDALFAPRPLAPLYDIALQVNKSWTKNIYSIVSTPELFAKFLEEFSTDSAPVVIVFEDIHWADAGTLDFIKFFARRIHRIQCLFIVTSRDDEINHKQPLKGLLGDLATSAFTRVDLTPLSESAVYKLASEKGYDPENVYGISGGNPFYVNEILASYSPGIPSSIKDAILSVYNRQEGTTREAWQLLSVLPEGLEVDRLVKIDAFLHSSIEDSLESKILLIKNDRLFFKHELYRRTIENSLSPFKRVALHKKLLELFLTAFEEHGETERIVHHAKNANENGLVCKYAPIAAKQAALVGSHIESSRLYFTAIEYDNKKDIAVLVQLYENYAYECYLTNQLNDAIIYQTKALKIRKEKDDFEKIGNGLRFLSRLWWFEGNSSRAETFANEAIDMLKGQPESKAMALAFCHLAQLKSSTDQVSECVYWSEKAIAIGHTLNDEEIISQALINMGSSLMMEEPTRKRGIDLLHQSLSISRKNCYHENVGRAYGALSANSVTMKHYHFAEENLNKGIQYCEEKQVDSIKLYMQASQARLYLETGRWEDAHAIAENLLRKEHLPLIIKIGALNVSATIKIRKGDADALSLLTEARNKSFQTNELQRIVPVFLVLLEFEWITGKSCVEEQFLRDGITKMIELGRFSKESRLYFWLRKTGKKHLFPETLQKGRASMSPAERKFWSMKGSEYEKALILFEGSEEEKRNALTIVQRLGATAVGEKMKMEMRSSGIKKIPRGLRASTKSNPAQLTNRELDVLQLLKQASQNKEIAERLFISPKTVDHHISSILFKLEVNSRSKAVVKGIQMGILETDRCGNN